MIYLNRHWISLGINGELYAIEYGREPETLQIEPIAKIWKCYETEAIFALSKTNKWYRISLMYGVIIFHLKFVGDNADVSHGIIYWYYNYGLYYYRGYGNIKGRCIVDKPQSICFYEDRIVGIDNTWVLMKKLVFFDKLANVPVKPVVKIGWYQDEQSIDKYPNYLYVCCVIWYEDGTVLHIDEDNEMTQVISLPDKCIDMEITDHNCICYSESGIIYDLVNNETENCGHRMQKRFENGKYFVSDNVIAESSNNKKIVVANVPISDVGGDQNEWIICLKDGSVYRYDRRSNAVSRLTFFDENLIYKPKAIKNSRKVSD